MMVEIRFKRESVINDILRDKKVATTRRSNHGDVGDTFVVAGKEYEIVAITECSLKYACEHFYNREGYLNAFNMLVDLLSFYPKLELTSVVYVHQFRAKDD